MDNSRRFFIGVTIIGVALLAGVIGYNVFNNMSGDVSMNRAVTNYVGDDENVTIFRRNFIDGCLQADPKQEAYCKCSFDGMVKRIGMKELLKMSIDIDAGKDISKKHSEAMANSAIGCIDLYIIE